MSKSCVVIGIAGGSGSGKTTVAFRVVDAIPASDLVVLSHDNYYHDLGHLPPAERAATNFDHPDSLDNELLIHHINELRAGRSIERPLYDFSTHQRLKETVKTEPARVLVVEGILVLVDPRLRDLMDIKLFVDIDPDIRFIRRLKRDVNERGRNLESVVEQYTGFVRPMHLQFVEPSKRYADIIIPFGGHNTIAVDMITTKINAILSG